MAILVVQIQQGAAGCDAIVIQVAHRIAQVAGGLVTILMVIMMVVVVVVAVHLTRCYNVVNVLLVSS